MMVIRANTGAQRLYDILFYPRLRDYPPRNLIPVYPLKVKPDDVGGRFRSNVTYPTPFSSPSDELSTLLFVDQTAVLPAHDSLLTLIINFF